jgi:hypothetical protein
MHLLYSFDTALAENVEDLTRTRGKIEVPGFLIKP